MHKGLGALMILLCCAVGKLTAQHTFSFNNGPEMDKFQDSLLRLNEAAFNAGNNEQRFALNAQFIKTLVNSLKTHGSFSYPFDSLKKISVVKSADNSFRIFSWHLPVDDGTYRFFGSIQMATKDGKLKLYPLIDNTENIKDPNQVTNNKMWYGATYYEIVPVISSGKQPYYVLIGWKGNNTKTSKKVIDILSFVKEEPVFGKAVFSNNNSKNRVIFEYNKLNSMTLKTDKNVGMIVFDHLTPFTPDLAGNFEFYASDLSFDAYKIVNGKLKLIENVELKNDPNAQDDLYADPADKKNQPARKL